MEIISRAEAKRRGLKRYFTGKPCKNGMSLNGTCVITAVLSAGLKTIAVGARLTEKSTMRRVVSGTPKIERGRRNATETEKGIHRAVTLSTGDADSWPSRFADSLDMKSKQRD